MKRLFMLLLCLMMICACNKKEIKQNEFNSGQATNILNQTDKDKVKGIFLSKGLSNVDIFFNWMDDFNKEEDLGCGINNWTNNLKLQYNENACADRYEKNHSISDGNCRLTAFALIDDKLKIKDTVQNYGTYLMFDFDVLENNEDYKVVNEKFDKFVTLFDEIDISKEKLDDLDKVFTNKWKNYGISIDDGDVSLISVVMHDPYSKVLFVGHTGVLIKLDNQYLFVEKIAFEQPYQISIFDELNDLKEMFKSRPTYFGDEKEMGPFVYQNDKLLFTLK